MKIEKFEDLNVYHGAKVMIKINEIIDKLNSRENIDEYLNKTLPDQIDKMENMFNAVYTFEKRLSDLEQCPVNDYRLCQPNKYKPDDFSVSLSLRLDKLEEKQSIQREFIDIHKEKLNELQNDINNLRKCHNLNRNDVLNLKEKAILKPDYDTEDVKLKSNQQQLDEMHFITNHQIANEGTFEWALIQMKKGKFVRRPHMKAYIAIRDLYSITLKHEDFVAEDWRIIE